MQIKRLSFNSIFEDKMLLQQLTNLNAVFYNIFFHHIVYFIMGKKLKPLPL